jgi:hypothetical protein
MVPVRFLVVVPDELDRPELGRITNTAVITDLIWNVAYLQSVTVGIFDKIYFPVMLR